MLSYSVGGFISVNTTLIIDAWLTSSKRLIEMQWMMKHQMTLCLIVQVTMTLLDGVQKAIPCFILLWSCKFYLIFHRVVFGLKIMRNTTPSWKSSTSIKFWQYSSGWRIRLLISRQWYSTLSYVFWRVWKLCRGCSQSQTVYLLHYQNYPLFHVQQWNFQYSQEQGTLFSAADLMFREASPTSILSSSSQLTHNPSLFIILFIIVHLFL